MASMDTCSDPFRVMPLVKVKMIPSGTCASATICFACVRLKKLTRAERWPSG